jgi:hypothetical protein
LKQLSEELAGERIIVDNKNRGLGSRSGNHSGLPRRGSILRLL